MRKSVHVLVIFVVLMGFVVGNLTGSVDFGVPWQSVLWLSALWGLSLWVAACMRSPRVLPHHELTHCRCGYPLEGIREEVSACPECGRQFPYEEIVRMHASRRVEGERRGEATEGGGNSSGAAPHRFP